LPFYDLDLTLKAKDSKDAETARKLMFITRPDAEMLFKKK
jgi:hypothetical protein